jgi:hypothetical protein
MPCDDPYSYTDYLYLDKKSAAYAISPHAWDLLEWKWDPNAVNAITQQRRLPMLWGTFSGRTMASL